MRQYQELPWVDEFLSLWDEDEPVSREEARKWLARCRATLIGATLSSKLRSSREKEEGS